MQLVNLIAFTLPVWSAMAAPAPQATSTASATASSSAPITWPTTAYGIVASHSTSDIHLQSLAANNHHFYIGRNTSSYCPESVPCPEGPVYTYFAGLCGMDVTVPGGQQIWVAPDGSIGFTVAHSAAIPKGANLCPFAYEQDPGSLGIVSLNPQIAFGAVDFMACPVGDGSYQVFAALDDAVVPQGNVSDCIGFGGVAAEYDGPAAWQYI